MCKRWHEILVTHEPPTCSTSSDAPSCHLLTESLCISVTSTQTTPRQLCPIKSTLNNCEQDSLTYHQLLANCIIESCQSADLPTTSFDILAAERRGNEAQARLNTRCSAIAERPRCRVHYSFRQK